MSGIVLQATAFKISNRGGGTMVRRKPGSVPDENGHVEVIQKEDTGSDYVHFICPRPECGHRNKMCMYESEPYHDRANDRIPFKCRMCRTVIEVTRPPSSHPLIILADQRRPQRPSGNLIITG